ncbi:MAG: dihydroorotate dehydrogenase [Candidatus Diapherotrites archaeon]|nr:dihydroorotate dehydrogenase [Candidatus Diapherotrites archaeon]
MNNLEINFCKNKMNNPFVLASGVVWNSIPKLIECAKNNAGAVTTKTIMNEFRPGHPNPTIARWEAGLINAVGLPSKGFNNMEDEWTELNELKKIKPKVPLIASIGATKASDFKTVAEFVAGKNPDMIEINISCPNVSSSGKLFATNPGLSSLIVEEVKSVAGKIPVIPKLTPATSDLIEVAKACEEAGADAICAINTMPGMLIDIVKKKPVLSFKRGGVSGTSIRPVAVRCIYDLYENIKIPILGMGGVMNGKDAIELMMAGATTIGLGTAVIQQGTNVFKKISEETNELIEKNGYGSLKNLIGAAHE